MYVFLDYFFVVFHSGVVAFNLTAWAWKVTRRAHLFVISLTMASWFGLGLVFGWGYCPCTDWHWQVKYTLGETALPASYVKYYLDRLTGYDWNTDVVDGAVLVLGLAAFAVSVWLNWRDWSRSRRVGE